MQRAPAAAEIIRVTETPETHGPKAASISAPPGMVKITWTNRQPAKRSKTKSDSDEGNVSRRPDWTIETNSEAAVDRSRPPCPSAAVHEPTAIVIWRPAPRLCRNPCPAVVWFPNPAARAVRSPARRLVRNPYLTVIRNFGPLAVRIQILRAGVVAVGVFPTVGMFNQAVAILVERVPIRLRRRITHFVLHVVTVALHRDHLSAANTRAALRRGNSQFAARVTTPSARFTITSAITAGSATSRPVSKIRPPQV